VLLFELREADATGACAGEEEQEQLAGGERLMLGELGEQRAVALGQRRERRPFRPPRGSS